MRPVFKKVSQLQSKCCQVNDRSKRRAAASSTRIPSGTTSRPIPSPSITAILYLFNLPHCPVTPLKIGNLFAQERRQCAHIGNFFNSAYEIDHVSCLCRGPCREG